MNDLIISNESLPPFPSILFREERVKFLYYAELFGRVAGVKKPVFFHAFRTIGIAFNCDVFKNVSSVLKGTNYKREDIL
jgi:hypothetical protein